MARIEREVLAMTDILLVDDETPFLQSLVEGLGIYAGNLNVITAENGKKAVEILKTVAVDLVITDLKMPVMDGFELLEYLKREHPEIRVMVMSMLDGPEIQARLKGLGVSQFIEKPIDFRAIINKILVA
jgi:YesN/AraC family two-component response regulator